ncbi:protein of unknown function [Mucilaginibacter pineti]|uniref:DUF4920 domain-containing protein n=1 Tax=Mucilaginibacter pineti TaxID=1391627 RepID=A0A1G7DSC3_9SPHI|nr:DUF4920 domain-containing protein [Mucilaginibacter pineti]SDE54383.1 protein of unknown function [Mucilaginibacter pineti]
MKVFPLLVLLFYTVTVSAQKHVHLPHGMVYGKRPDTMALQDAKKIEAFMGKKTRISTTIEGKVTRVTKEKGGWFELDAGDGRIIAAHFSDYNINIPANLAGRTVIIEGVAAKQFIADDLQHMAGDTVTGKKQHQVKTDPKKRIVFEVKGLMVDI